MYNICFYSSKQFWRNVVNYLDSSVYRYGPVLFMQHTQYVGNCFY